MADTKDKDAKKQDASKPTEPTKAAQDAKPAGSMGWIGWVVLAGVCIAGATGGFALSQLVGGSPAQTTAATQQATQPAKNQTVDPLKDLQGQNGTNWFYDNVEPVLANLDEPGVARYVRVTLSLEVSGQLDPVKGKEFLDQRQMLLRDWLTTYFSGLSLEDVRGSRNLNRIKRDVLDQFNALLFANSKPYIVQVLFKEFAVQ